MAETEIGHLNHATTAGPDAVTVLGAALHLACDGMVPVRKPTWWCAQWDEFADVIVRVDKWLHAWLGHDEYQQAWKAAAAVLSAAADERFAGIAELIDVFLDD